MRIVFPLAILFALVFAGVANAGDLTRGDARESRSPLDIASVSHHYLDGPTVTHTLRTYRAFSSRLLKGDNVVGFAFDLNADFKPDRFAIAFWSGGRLRGVLFTAAVKPLATVAVSRPNARTVSIALPVRLFGTEGNYRWAALSEFQSRTTCKRSCTDFAPNSGPIPHRLWYLQTLSIGVTGSGRVTSAQAAVDCTATCNRRLRRGTALELQATPDPGYVFTGWGGACAGTGTCTVTVGSDTVVTATFAPAPPPPDPSAIVAFGALPRSSARRPMRVPVD